MSAALLLPEILTASALIWRIIDIPTEDDLRSWVALLHMLHVG